MIRFHDVEHREILIDPLRVEQVISSSSTTSHPWRYFIALTYMSGASATFECREDVCAKVIEVILQEREPGLDG
jgi:hypothetical protein